MRVLLPRPAVKPAVDRHTLPLYPERLLAQVCDLPEVQSCLSLLGPLAWDAFPERDLQRNWGQESTPYAAFAAACLWNTLIYITLNLRLLRRIRRQP